MACNLYQYERKYNYENHKRKSRIPALREVFLAFLSRLAFEKGWN